MEDERRDMLGDQVNSIDEHRKIVGEALRLLAQQCSRLKALCYWAGTSAIAVDGLEHRISHDLDFHTKCALIDVRPILAEIQRAFGDGFELLQSPDSFGSGFSGVLALPSGSSITLEVMSNYEDTPEADLTDCRIEPAFTRVNLTRYLADKVQCVAERAEARDLVDILAVLASDSNLEQVVRRILKEQDAVILVERLLGWTEESVAKDLASYSDISPAQAITARDLLLRLIKEEGLL